MNSAKFIVSGKVQGVFFRAATRTQALQLGLTGYAKNLDDGSVEIIATGSNEQLVLLEKWLWIGPPAAVVEDVKRLSLTNIEPRSGFATL